MRNRIMPEIALGANICAKIKHIFFPDQKWTESIQKDVSKKFGLIKIKAREFFLVSDDQKMLEAQKQHLSALVRHP